MGTICIEVSTGLVREWVRHGAPPTYDAAVHLLLEAETPPDIDARYDAATKAWVAVPPSPRPIEIARETARATIDVAVADRTIPSSVREALAAIKQALA